MGLGEACPRCRRRDPRLGCHRRAVRPRPRRDRGHPDGDRDRRLRPQHAAVAQLVGTGLLHPLDLRRGRRSDRTPDNLHRRRAAAAARRPAPAAVGALKRCGWVPEQDLLYVAYHDEEWGVPSHDDRHLFELLVLEGAQAGLSWSTILNKRAGYQKAFAGFDPEAVARFGARDVKRLLGDAGIVRHRARSKRRSPTRRPSSPCRRRQVASTPTCGASSAARRRRTASAP